MDPSKRGPGPDLPRAVWAHCLVKIDTTHVMMIGGDNDKDGYTGTDTFTIDFSTEIWTDGPPMINKRSVHACARLDSGLIVAAGGNEKSSVEILKPGATSWIAGNVFVRK